VFWILAGSFFICGASTNGLVGTHLIPACMDHGIPEVRAAGLLAVEFGADKAGLVFGWIFAAHQIGAALATTVAGVIRTTEGS
jgi:hypothetical protein